MAVEKFTDKRKAVEILLKNGFDAEYTDGVVMIYDAAPKEADKACKAIGYIASYGVKQRRKNGTNESETDI